MEAKILNSLNGSLEENLEIEELEKRIEMLVLSPELLQFSGCESLCQGDGCDDYHCSKD